MHIILTRCSVQVAPMKCVALSEQIGALFPLLLKCQLQSYLCDLLCNNFYMDCLDNKAYGKCDMTFVVNTFYCYLYVINNGEY
ncbi:hypothetical protein TNCT_18751 [Trichonephila clavata]|uniref:Uncharacterized protein n=1 Tax=Trichonephila clavata TaxID=2740835 RepID=A0A8X6LQK1_TRICU|nr:hypothetical protein TNCT_18751 [Trichonephila clavata]